MERFQPEKHARPPNYATNVDKPSKFFLNNIIFMYVDFSGVFKHGLRHFCSECHELVPIAAANNAVPPSIDFH